MTRGRAWTAGGISLLVALLLACAITGAAAAGRAGAEPVARAARCSPSAGALSPQLVTPCDRAVVRAGSTVTFVVHDTNSFARQYHPYLIVALSRKRLDGELQDVGADGLMVKMSTDRGHKGLFVHSTKHDVLVDFPGYWLTTPRTYYVQIAQIDNNALPYGDRYSPIEKLTVKG